MNEIQESDVNIWFLKIQEHIELFHLICDITTLKTLFFTFR